MSRSVSLVVATALCGVGMVGCGGDDQSSNKNDAPPVVVLKQNPNAPKFKVAPTPQSAKPKTTTTTPETNPAAPTTPADPIGTPETTTTGQTPSSSADPLGATETQAP